MKTLLAFVAFLIVFAAGSTAADEAVSSKASSSASPPLWTGFYVGLNAGGFWNSSTGGAVNWANFAAASNSHFASSLAAVSAPTGFASARGYDGFSGGGQIGYNWQVTDKIVVGVETDFQGRSGFGNSMNAGGFPAPSPRRGAGSIGSVRGRSGVLIAPDLLIYGTGGFAYGGAN